MDALGFGTVFWIVVGLLLWTALAFFIAPFIGRWLRGDFSEDHPQCERVGFDEPSEFEHWQGERAAAAARGRAHAERSRRRRAL